MQKVSLVKRFSAAIALTIVFIFATLPDAVQASPHGAGNDGKHHWLFPNHPRLRRITKAAGFGVVTGGLAAPFLGASVATGAVAGAAEHSAVRGYKDHHDMKKKGHLDHHWW